MRQNNTNCSVYGCSSKKSREPDVHFHYFPKENSHTVNITNKSGLVERVNRLRAWKDVLLMDRPVTKNTRVCSKHFAPSDYVMKTGELNSKISPRLKFSAVPSRNLPSELNVLKIAKRRKRADVRKDKKNQNWCLEMNEKDEQTHEEVIEKNDLLIQERIFIQGLEEEYDNETSLCTTSDALSYSYHEFSALSDPLDTKSQSELRQRFKPLAQSTLSAVTNEPTIIIERENVYKQVVIKNETENMDVRLQLLINEEVYIKDELNTNEVLNACTEAFEISEST